MGPIATDRLHEIVSLRGPITNTPGGGGTDRMAWAGWGGARSLMGHGVLENTLGDTWQRPQHMTDWWGGGWARPWRGGEVSGQGMVCSKGGQGYGTEQTAGGGLGRGWEIVPKKTGRHQLQRDSFSRWADKTDRWEQGSS